MTYLHPPPGDAPVVVMKDVGGYVSDYAAQTAVYFTSGREVRLHECRSACTLALSLPNVCVFPSSLLKFHKAYNPKTKVANEEISQAMMDAYPAAVRERLGVLTRNYRTLTGSELIRLGVRECGTPRRPEIMLARARVKANPPENPVSNAFSGLVATLSPQAATPASGAQVAVQRVKAQAPRDEAQAPRDEAAAPPLPPPRPPELPANGGAAVGAAQPAPAPSQPPAEAMALTSDWMRPIRGSAPILVAARFAPYPYRLARKS